MKLWPMFLGNETPKIINFPFVPNKKIFLGVPKFRHFTIP